MNITQADRDAMARRFENSDECRLRPRPMGDGWMHASDVIYDQELKRLIEMIRGGQAIPPVCTCKGSSFGMDVDRAWICAWASFLIFVPALAWFVTTGGGAV